MTDVRRFDGKVALITGGAKGFGLTFAESLCAEGATSVIADIDAETAARSAAGLRERGYEAIAVQCDVANETEVEAAVARAVAETGGIDILVNNAGLHLSKYNQAFSVLPRADVRACLEVNVVGVINCSLACIGSMRERGGGAIVSISSISGYMSNTPYGVSKLAVRGLTVAFAKEFADANVRVNAIAPGLIGTPTALADLPQELVDTLVNDHQLIHRLGQPDDVVNLGLFLCSDAASFITGETVKVSGGTPLFV